jgi:hypothetical protein
MALLYASVNMFALLEDLHIEGENESSPPSPTSSNIDAVSPEDSAQEHEEAEREEAKRKEAKEDEENRIAELVVSKKIDLLALEEASGQQPIYTKALLRDIAHFVARLTQDQALPESQRRQVPLYFTHPDGQKVIFWEPSEDEDPNAIKIDYMARVETSPFFQAELGDKSDKSRYLRDINQEAEIADLWNPPPYILSSFWKKKSSVHLNPATMQTWRTRLQNLQQLWEASASCAQIFKLVQSGAAKLTKPITKIVCFGLGAVERAKVVGLDCAIQHMTAFTLAELLTTYNAGNFPDAPAVKVILQDPCYQQCDRILWPELTSAPVDFDMSNPEALLAVDANALVMTAFLPVDMPLVQIIADMYNGNAKEGPGMMLCDRMEDLKPDRRWYSLSHRGAPHVARFLQGGYWSSQANWVGLEEELTEAMGHDRYWLQKMTLWLRKE